MASGAGVVVELVRFEASGLDTLAAATAAYAERAAAAQKQADLFRSVIRDGSFQRHAAAITAAGQQFERQALAVRNSQYAHQLAAGAIGRQAAAVAQLTARYAELQSRGHQQVAGQPGYVAGLARAESTAADQQAARGTTRTDVLAHRLATGDLQRQVADAQKLEYTQGRIQQQARNGVLAKELTDGTLAKRAGEMAALRRETEALEKKGKLTSLVAEHGRWGGVLRANADEVRTLQRTALVGYGVMTAGMLGLVRAGLQGTVEGYRLEYAWTRLGRQVAGIAVPAVNKIADAVGMVAGKFEKLDGRQQNALLTMGAIAVLAGPVVGAVRAVGAVGGAALSLGASVWAASRAAPAMPAAPLPAIPIPGAVPGGAAPPPGKKGGTGILPVVGTGLKLLPPVAAALSVGDAATGGYYDIQRAKGNNRLVSGMAAMGAGFMNILSQPLALFGEKTFGERYREKAEKEGFRKPGGARSEVSPLYVGDDELGSAHTRIQQEVLKVSVAKEQERQETLAKALEENTRAVQEATAQRQPNGQPWDAPPPFRDRQ